MKAAPSNNPIVNMIDNKTSWYSAVDPKTSYAPYNPDDIYQKRGDYSIYEDMMKDDQVSVAMQIKKDLVIGSGWEIQCENDDQQEMKNDIEVALKEDCESSFDDILHEIISGYEFGFSISEKQFKKRNNGSLTLKNIRTRDPVSWLFHQDEFGNIVRYEQQGTSSNFRDVDKNALMHFINNPRFGNPYGTSDLRAAYTAFFIKTQIVRFYAVYLEKAASPTPIGKYDKKLAEEQDISKLFNTLKKLQTSSAMVIPKELEVEFLEAKTTGEAFIKGIGLFNMFIGRALFVPDLLGFQGNETSGGSHALGKEQIKIFIKHIVRRRNSLENVINNHIIKPIVNWNYGKVDNYPKFKLKQIDEDIAERNAKLWIEAIKGNAFKPSLEDINQFKEIINFPESKIEDMQTDPIDQAAQKASFSFDSKEDYSDVEKMLNDGEKSTISKAQPFMKHMINGLVASIDDLKVNSVDQMDKINKLGFKKSEKTKLAKILKDEFLKTNAKARELAAKEIKKENFAIDPEDEFLAILERENLSFIGDWEYNVTKQARVAIIAAIKDGVPISSVIDLVSNNLDKNTEVALERYVRTKHTEVMNKARKSYFDSTGFVGGYQFSAVLDGRTSLICQSLHGKVFKKGTEPTPPLHFACRSLLIPLTIYEEIKPDEKIGDDDIQDFIRNNKGLGF